MNDVCVSDKPETRQRSLPTVWRDLLEQSISLEEVHIAMGKEGRIKPKGVTVLG